MNDRLDLGPVAPVARSVTVRRVIPEHARTHQPFPAEERPNVNTVLMRLSSATPLWPAAGRWLVAAAVWAHQSKQLIRHLETRGWMQARAAMARHTAAMREATLEICSRTCADWSEARGRRASRIREAQN